MQISPILHDYAAPPTPKTVFGEMAVGDTRAISGDARERRNWRKSAHWVGKEFGWAFRTRSQGELLMVTRIA